MQFQRRVAAFGAFFKEYAQTWHHAVATAALTAFGMLTFVDTLFAVVALLAYVLPPAVLYYRSATERDGQPERPEDRLATGTGDDAASSEERVDRPSPAAGGGTSAWTVRATPTDETLTAVTVDGEHAYAVGTAGSLLVDDGDGWAVAVADGVDAASSALRGVDATACAVWVAGDGGTVGRFDPETDRHVSYSAPTGDTTNLLAVAAAGSADDETLLVADGSGRLRRGRYRDDQLSWDEPVTPGSGSSLCGVVLPTDAVGYACDTNQSVFRTDDSGETFQRIGLDATGTLTDITASAPDSCLVCNDQGVAARYDGRRWTPERVGDVPLRAVAGHGEEYVVGGDAGTVFERGPASPDWTRVPTPATVPLRGVAVNASRAVAVGADGTVVER